MAKKLGMGLSSLLSSDSALDNIIGGGLSNKESFIQQTDNKMDKISDKIKIISGKETGNEDGRQIKLPIHSLVSGKYQPRKNFDQSELEELAESIRVNGVLQPILVRPISNASKSFEIIAGERRWRASQIAKIHQVPVIVRNFDDETLNGVAMIENLQRSDLNVIEEAEGYRTMMNNFSIYAREII